MGRRGFIRTSKLQFLILLILSSFGQEAAINAATYDRSAVATYADKWWNTDLDSDGKVDNINWPTYSYYFNNGTSYNRETNHNKLDKDFGWDCANFGSQCIKAGGVNLGLGSTQNMGNGIGRGGTTIRVVKLRELLRTISTRHEFVRKEDADVILSTGDVITWRKIVDGKTINHTTIIVKGSGPNVVLSAHTTDRKQVSLSTYFDSGYSTAIAFHITGLNARASADQTSPTVIVKNSSTGQQITDESFTNANSIDIQVTEVGGIFDGLNIFRGESQTDAGDAADLSKGVFGDPRPSSNSRTYTLSSLPEDRIVIDAWDDSGNFTQRTFTVDRHPPLVVAHQPTGSRIAILSDIVMELSEPINTATMSGGVVVLDGVTALSGDLTFVNEDESQQDANEDGDMDDFVLTFRPANDLPANKTLTVRVRDTLTDLAGNKLDGDRNGLPGGEFSWTFATEIPAPLIAHRFVPQAYTSDDLIVESTVTAYQGSLSRVELYYRNEADRFNRYTKVDMTKTGNLYKGIIPGGALNVDKGLEYFIYAVDANNRATSQPPIDFDPFIFSSTAQSVQLFADNNQGNMIVGDQSTVNDDLQVSFRLRDDLPTDNSVRVEIFEADHDFSNVDKNNPEVVLDQVVRLGSPKGVYSFTVQGRQFLEGNYAYSITQVNFSREPVKTLVEQGRMRVIKPLAKVDLLVTSRGASDIVNVTASGTTQKLAASTVFSAKSLFQTTSEQGPGPSYNMTTPHAARGHAAAVYSTFADRQILVGFSDVPNINTDNAPEIIVSRLGTQTHNHSIAIDAKITDLLSSGGIGEVVNQTLFYKSAGDAVFQQAPMQRIIGDTFRGFVAAQPGNNDVAYYVQATDNQGHTSTDPFFDPQPNAYTFHVVKDLTPPSVAVAGLRPLKDAKDVPLETTINISFNEPMKNIGIDKIQLRDADGNVVPIDSAGSSAQHIRVAAQDMLRPDTLYTVTVLDSLQDLSGNTLAGGNFSWSFRTLVILPPAINKPEQVPVNFTMASPVMTMSANFSETVSTVTMVLTNVGTGDVVRVVDPAGTPAKATYPFNYQFNWDGTVGNSPIPEGVYEWRVEARSRKHGVLGNSDIKPFQAKVEGTGLITYDKHCEATAGKSCTFVPNFAQGIIVNYDYHKIKALFSSAAKFYRNGGSHKLGSSKDRLFGKSGSKYFSVGANDLCGLKAGSGGLDLFLVGLQESDRSNPVESMRELIDVVDDSLNELLDYQDFNGTSALNVRYTRRYPNASQKYFTTPTLHLSSDLLTRDQDYSETFQIHLNPLSRDPDEWNTTLAVRLDNAQVLAPGENKDFDQNSAVQTYVETTPIGENGLTITLHARVIEPAPKKIIYDVTPPNISVAVSRPIFSPALGQDTVFTFALSDNLPLGLKNTSVKLFDGHGRLLQILYEKLTDVDGDRSFAWSGADAEGQLVADGVYKIVAYAEDAVGNTSQTESTVIVDTTPPAIAAAVLQVRPGLFSGTLTSNDTNVDIHFGLSDQLSTDVVVEVSNLLRSTFSVSAISQDFSMVWDGKDLQGNPFVDGDHVFTLKATDLAGNTTSYRLAALKIDRTPPLVDYLYADTPFFTPDDGAEGRGNGIADVVNVTYRFSSQAQVVFSVEDRLGRSLYQETVSQARGQEKQFVWNGKVGGIFVADGPYVFRLKASDEFGNSSSEKITVIKNQIPAKIAFPTTLINGKVDIQGFAMDPLINDTMGFAGYRLWAREGTNINFALPENNPDAPSSAHWIQIPVPVSYQSPDLMLNPTYPDSNLSKRSVSNTTLGYWDTEGLTAGTTYTLLLVASDNARRFSMDMSEMVLDAAVDAVDPAVAVAVHSSDTVKISYTLNSPVGHNSHVSVDVIAMSPTLAYGPVVFHRDFLNQSTGREIIWDGRDVQGALVRNGTYRVRVTARDVDHIGIGVEEEDFTVSIAADEPIKIQDFSASAAVVAPNENIRLSFTLSKEANVLIQGFDAARNRVATYSTQAVSGFINYQTDQNGLYQWVLTATSLVVSQTKDTASLSVAVGLRGTGTQGEISSTNPPASNGAVSGVANFSWMAEATGDYLPIQSFSPTVKADGKEQLSAQTVLESAFESGEKIRVENRNGDLGLRLENRAEEQTRNDLIAGTAASWITYTAQGFVSSRSGFLKSVSFMARWGSDVVIIQFRRDNNGQPGEIVSEVNLGFSGFDYNGRWLTANFNESISANTKYWVGTRVEHYVHQGPPQNGLAFYGVNFDNYGGGSAMFGYESPGYYPLVWTPGSYSPIYKNIQDLAFRVVIDAYADSGRYISDAIDTGSINAQTYFEPLTANETLNGQSISYKFQTSDDGASWGPEFTVDPGQPITFEGKRYLRNIVDMVTIDNRYTPILRDYSYAYKLVEPFSYSKTLDEYSTFTNKPTYIPQAPLNLSAFFPEIAGKNLAQGPSYSVTNTGNTNVDIEVTNENAIPQLKAATHIMEPWNNHLDPNLSTDGVHATFVEFNNSPNPFHFPLATQPITISSAYSVANMLVQSDVKNKFLFWKNNDGATVDNPYVAVKANEDGWKLKLTYPDNTPNDSLLISQDKTKLSNTNIDPDTEGTAWDVDDDFTVKLATGATAKVFVELRGRTPARDEGFESYALTYRKIDEAVTRPIYVSSPTRAVLPGEPLGYWDVSGMRGEYQVTLTVLKNGAVHETHKNVTIGTFVPRRGRGTETTYVVAPYNRAFLEFPAGALAEDTLVTITPKKLTDSRLRFDGSQPQPVGMIYEIYPKNIKFAADEAGKILTPGSLTARFLPGELEGVNPGLLTLYGVSEDGTIQPFDARITIEGDITTIVSPFTGSAYYVALSTLSAPVVDVLPAVSLTSAMSISGTALPMSTVDVFNNAEKVGEVKAESDGRFALDIHLVEGTNAISAQARTFFHIEDHRVDQKSPLSSQQTTQLDATSPAIGFVAISSPAFSPYEGQTSTLSFVLSEPVVASVSVQLNGCLANCTRYFLQNVALPQGPSLVNWDGKNTSGELVAFATHTYVIELRDGAGNLTRVERTVRVVVPQPPLAVVREPQAGSVYSPSGENIQIDFSVYDDIDSSPTFTAFLQHENERIPVSTGSVFKPLSLSTGAWSLTIDMADRFGNSTQTVTGPFNVVHDIYPPRTRLEGGISHRIPVRFTAEDDLFTSGDNAGIGVKETFFLVEGEKQQLFMVYKEPFKLAIGTYTIHFYSVDGAGNREALNHAEIQVGDVTAPPAVPLLTTKAVSTQSISVAWSLAPREMADDELELNYALHISSQLETLLSSASVHTRGVISWTIGASTLCVIEGLNPATTYYATVYLIDAYGNKSPPMTASVATLSVPLPPRAPRINDYAVIAVSSDAIAVTWTMDEPDDKPSKEKLFSLGLHMGQADAPLDDFSRPSIINMLDHNTFAALFVNLNPDTDYASQLMYSSSASIVYSNVVSTRTLSRVIPALGRPAIQTIVMGEIYVYPNPVRKNQTPVFHVEVDEAERVTIQIYDVLGDPIKEFELHNAALINDGQGDQRAFEVAWDEGIPAGVYLYVVTCEKAGESPQKRSGRFAVVR